MPIYQYRCSACGELTELIQKFSDDPLEICPQCGEPELRKQLTAPAFKLKGSGWYVTDFRDSGKPKEQAKGDSGGDKAATKTESTTGGSGGEKSAKVKKSD